MYKKYDTERKGRGAVVDKINEHHMKGKYYLDTISVAEACFRGEPFNWCGYLLHELIEACEDFYKGTTYFIYGYLVIVITMMKWCTPKGREVVDIYMDNIFPLLMLHGGLRLIPLIENSMKRHLRSGMPKCCISLKHFLEC